MIEAVFYRHFAVYSHEADSVKDAGLFLSRGEEYGELSSVGVFVDGVPTLTDQYVSGAGRPPTAQEAVWMREAYARIAKGATWA